MKCSVNGLTVLVTGANRQKGIGRALVEEALQRGAKKVYATARDLSSLEDLVAKHPGKVVALELDVTNREQILKTAQVAHDTQVLINNAGMAGFSGCHYNYQEDIVRQEFEINFFGPMNLMHAFTENLTKNGSAAIVNIISIAALMPFPMAVSYSASKAAFFSLTQASRVELAQHGIPVFGVYPGPIDTDMSKNLTVDKTAPEEVAKRVYDGMEAGTDEITTDPLSDHFGRSLEKDVVAIEAVKKQFGQGNHH